MHPPRIADWVPDRPLGSYPYHAHDWSTLRAFAGILLLVASALVAAQPTLAAQDAAIEIQYEGEVLALEPAPNQTIQGTSTLEPGTEVAVRLQSTGDSPFIKSTRTTVSQDGSWSVSFDLSGIDPTTIRVIVQANDGNVTTETDGRIGSPETTTARQTLDLPTDITVQHGSTATIPVSMPAGESAVLAIGSADAGYRVVIRVADATEDGTVAVTFDTNAAGTDAPTVGVEGTDRFEVVDPEPVLNGSLPGGSYDLALAADTQSDPVAIGSLVVDGGGVTTTSHPDEPDAPTNLVPPLSDPFWRTTAPGIAGVLAFLSGLVSILISRR